MRKQPGVTNTAQPGGAQAPIPDKMWLAASQAAPSHGCTVCVCHTQRCLLSLKGRCRKQCLHGGSQLFISSKFSQPTVKNLRKQCSQKSASETPELESASPSYVHYRNKYMSLWWITQIYLWNLFHASCWTSVVGVFNYSWNWIPISFLSISIRCREVKSSRRRRERTGGTQLTKLSSSVSADSSKLSLH